jgi:ABC-2 type transport system permease protein
MPGKNLINSLWIIWTLAFKDITDAIRNKMVLSLVVMLSIALLLPKALPFMFERTATVVPIYDSSQSSLVKQLRSDSRFIVQKVNTTEELHSAVCTSISAVIGLIVPAQFDLTQAGSKQVALESAVCWGRRYQVDTLKNGLEQQMTESLGRPVTISVAGNIVYPPNDQGLGIGMVTLFAVTMILMIGMALVPNLLFEEKQSRTLDALLVSPASISQVVVGKALAGYFYILVMGAVVFALQWLDVTHWGSTVLFVLGGGLFSVGLGLALGSLFKNQQDMMGWMMVILLFFIGAVFVRMIGLELPGFVQVILPWVPSVAMAEVCRTAFSETASITIIAENLGKIVVISLPVYVLVVWKVSRSDR